MKTSTFQVVVCALMSIFQVSVNVVIAIRSLATQTLDVFQSVTNGVMTMGATILKTANRFLTPSGGTSSFRRANAIASPNVGYDWEAKKEPGTGRRIAASEGSGLISQITAMFSRTVSVMIPTRTVQAPLSA